MKNKTKSGIALPIAVLIISISLVISLGVVNIIAKEIIFSTFGQKSEIAFYAADTGIECALYWDKQKEFAEDDSYGGPSEDVVCNSEVVGEENNPIGGTWNISNQTLTSAITKFDLEFGNGSCAIVTIDKDSNRPQKQRTKIESHGYNTGTNNTDCSSTEPNRVERALRVQY